MFRQSIICALSRLSLSQTSRNISTQQNPLYFQFTPCLYGEPLKRKKRIDPAVIKHREERRKKKIEKQIRRLEKNARQLKPLEELDVPLKLIDERNIRLRDAVSISPEESEARCLLDKEWARYKHKQKLADLQMIDRLMFAQQHALDELRKESEELYLEAIQIDPALIPFETVGPVSTPPIKNYESPDGEYIDVSRKWE